MFVLVLICSTVALQVFYCSMLIGRCLLSVQTEAKVKSFFLSGQPDPVQLCLRSVSLPNRIIGVRTICTFRDTHAQRQPDPLIRWFSSI